MSKACTKIAAVIAKICALYCSHVLSSRNRISLPGGNFDSLTPHRFSCRQSKNRHNDVAVGNRNSRRAFAIKYAKGQLSGLLANRGGRQDVATDGPSAKKSLGGAY